MMKFRSMVTIFAVLTCGEFAVAQQNNNAGSVGALANHADSVAYAFGLSIGQDLKHAGVETINTEALAQGITAVFEDTEKGFEEAVVRELIMRTITAAKEKADAKLQEEAKAFMEDNRTKEGIQTTASGLQYEIIREGAGGRPTPADSVTVHYKGQLRDGKVFDSSYDRGEPTTFTLERVIEGWQEGLQLMSAGAHYRIYIPHELAYGEQGAGQDIPPFSPLIFDVELISVQKSTKDIPAIDEPVNE